MKHPTLVLALLFTLSGRSAFAQTTPLDHAEILGRLAQGYSPSYVAHLVKIRGVNFVSSEYFLYVVKLAGGDGVLVERLFAADSSAQSRLPTDTDPSFSHLAGCAELIHTGSFTLAENECRASIEENPKSPWPILATARLLHQADSFADTSPQSSEERLNEQTRLLSRAAELAPNLASVHLALGSTMIPHANLEWQKASSLDPENLESGELSGINGPPIMFSLESLHGGSDLSSSTDENIVIRPETLRRSTIDPDLASTHLGLAIQYFEVRNFEKALSELREAIRLEPDNSGLHTNLAFFYLSRRNVEAGLAELRYSIRIVPFGMIPRFMLAGALESLGRTSDAVGELQNLITMYPTAIAPSNALVELYLDHKDRNSAIAELRRSIKASSLAFSDQAKFVNARLGDIDHLANLLKENRELEAAAEQYLFLFRYKAGSAGLHLEYGNVLFDQHRLDEAISEYNEALRLDPGEFSAHLNIGNCLALKKNLEGAVAEYRRALELVPDDPNTQILLGAALGQKGDLSAAMDQFQRAIAINPNDPEAHASLGYALAQLKDVSGAIRELNVALKLNPDSPNAENNLAWIYATTDNLALRNPTDALTLARLAVKTSEQPNPAFIDTLAEALLLNGQFAEALTTELHALALDPQNSDLLARLPRFREAARRSESPKP